MLSQSYGTKVQDFLASFPEEQQEFIPGKTAIPASGKVIGHREKALMIEAALDGWLTTGRFNDAFEEKIAQFFSVPYVRTVNSGSSANLVALSSLTSPQWGERRIQPGDEVITAAAGFPTTITPILQLGAIPVFVDVDSATWNVTIDAIEKAITPKTKAVMIAHTLGIPFDVEALTALCKKHNLWLVEDCCDALGAEWNHKKVGTFGDIATLSFYPAHHITTGEGGAVLTQQAELAKVIESFRDWGRHCHCRPGQDNACGRRFSGQYGELPEGYDHKYVYSHAGYNLKMTDMTAACGLAQMERVADFIATRRENYSYLYNRLKDNPYLHFIQVSPEASPSWFGFPILLDEASPCSRVVFLKELNKKKIGTRLMFAGNALRQPFMQGRQYRISGELHNTDRIMESGLWLGVWPGLTPPMLDYAADTILALPIHYKN